MPGYHIPKQKRQARHIKESEKKRGRSDKDAERIAWATVNARKAFDGREGVIFDLSKAKFVSAPLPRHVPSGHAMVPHGPTGERLMAAARRFNQNRKTEPGSALSRRDPAAVRELNSAAEAHVSATHAASGGMNRGQHLAQAAWHGEWAQYHEGEANAGGSGTPSHRDLATVHSALGDAHRIRARREKEKTMPTYAKTRKGFTGETEEVAIVTLDDAAELAKAGPGTRGGAIDHYTQDGRPVYVSQEKNRRESRRRRRHTRRLEREAIRVERGHEKERARRHRRVEREASKALVLDLAKAGDGGLSDHEKRVHAAVLQHHAEGGFGSVRKVREKVPDMSKKDFDRAALGLHAKGRVHLHHHDFPQSLSQAERDASTVHDDRPKTVEWSKKNNFYGSGVAHGIYHAGIFPKKSMSKAWKDRLPGGKADDKTPADFDPKKLREGAKHEREHTSNPKIAEEIAMDHLSEDPRYYSKLKRVEKAHHYVPHAVASAKGHGQRTRQAVLHLRHTAFTPEEHHQLAEKHTRVALRGGGTSGSSGRRSRVHYAMAEAHRQIAEEKKMSAKHAKYPSSAKAFDEPDLEKKVLTARARKKIKKENFALPGRRYPIEDENHARNALARVSQYGTPEEKKKVRAAVHRKYPHLGRSEEDEGSEKKKKKHRHAEKALYVTEDATMGTTKYEDLFKSELGEGDKVLIECPHCEKAITRRQVMEKAHSGGVGSDPPPASKDKVKSSRPAKGAPATPPGKTAIEKADACSDSSSGDTHSTDVRSKDVMSKAKVLGTPWCAIIDDGTDQALADMIEREDFARGAFVSVPIDKNNSKKRLLTS